MELTNNQKDMIKDLVRQEIFFANSRKEVLSVTELTVKAKGSHHCFKGRLGKSKEGTYDLPSCLEMKQILEEMEQDHGYNGIDFSSNRLTVMQKQYT